MQIDAQLAALEAAYGQAEACVLEQFRDITLRETVTCHSVINSVESACPPSATFMPSLCSLARLGLMRVALLKARMAADEAAERSGR